MARLELPLPEVVPIVVRAVIPLAGAPFLGWSAGNPLFIHGADTLASMYAVCVLACARLFAFGAGAGPAWWRRLFFGMQLALTALIPWIVIAVPLAATMGMVLVLAIALELYPNRVLRAFHAADLAAAQPHRTPRSKH